MRILEFKDMYETKPEVVKAMHFTSREASLLDCLDFCPLLTYDTDCNVYYVPTSQGPVPLIEGDYLLKKANQDNFFIAKPDYFKNNFQQSTADVADKELQLLS